MSTLARRLGRFDATMIVMGGIIGAGIFVNPAVVARHLHSTPTILLAWMTGGLIALLGAFVYAELAAIRPEAGGQYVYLRDAIHPSVAFLYGWGLLLVVQSGGMAAVAITFARYARELTGVATPAWIIAAVTIFVLTVINSLGVRSGSNTQNLLMILKLAAIAVLVFAGAFWVRESRLAISGAGAGEPAGLMIAFAAAMTPVMFSYGGWQTASFISGELRDPKRDLATGLIAGVGGVVLVYALVNFACLRVLGPEGLAATGTPASDVMRVAFGEGGARFIAAGIAISTLGFLSQAMLTAPRVYYAMASDGVFFEGVGRIHPVTRVPVFAVILQGLVAMAIAVSGTYEQILGYVVSTDFLFFGLTGITLLVFRARHQGRTEGMRMPGHPWTTLLFVLCCFGIVAGSVARSPLDSIVGLLILASGVPVYLWFRGMRGEG